MDFDAQIDLSGAEDALRPPRLDEGWYQFLVTEADVGSSANSGNIYLRLRVNPLKEVDDPTSAVQMGATHLVMLPLHNAAHQDHQVNQKFWGMFNRFLSYTSDFPFAPRWNKETRTQEYMGEPVVDEKETNQKHLQLIGAKALELAKEPTQLEGSIWYGNLSYDGTYTRISGIGTSLPEDVVLVEL